MEVYLGIKSLKVREYTAKIGFDNVASLRLFETSFGFQLVSESAVFKEKTLRLVVADESGGVFADVLSRLLSLAGCDRLVSVPYHNENAKVTC